MRMVLNAIGMPSSISVKILYRGNQQRTLQTMCAFFIRCHPLFLALALVLLLTSCFAPPKPLPQGTRLPFYNTIPSTVVVAETGIKKLFKNDVRRVEVPELTGMMRMVVMEEARKAGVICDYVVAPELEPARLGSGPDLARLEAKGVKIDNGACMLAIPGQNATTYGVYGPAGFALRHNRPLIPALATVDLQGPTIVTRYDDTGVRKNKASAIGIGGFGWGWQYSGFEGDRDWSDALPSSRANAVRGWEALFREAVAGAFGNPRPKLEAPTPAKAL